MRWPPSRRSADRAAAAAIYAAAVDAARRPALYRGHGVADNPQGRFEAVTLHLFAVLYRLMHNPGDDAAIARLVAESFVTHMDATLRETGVGDTAVPKRMRALYGTFAGRIEAYKAAFEAGEQALAAAIARNVLAEPSDPDKALVIARYLRSAVAALGDADLEEIRAGRLPFPALPETRAEPARP